MKKIYVGNLSQTVTEADLRTLFETHGAVQSVQMILDRETGKPRGFAFIEMPNDQEAQAAIAGTNLQQLGGKALVVNEARPRAEGGGGRRGGGYGRGGGGRYRG
jgi:RNA recognition motif-containing protein